MQITTNELRRMTNQEGLILQGCGGDMQEWVDGINELLTQEGILLEETEFKNVKSFRNEGLTNLLFPFEDVKLDLGKLAIWRIKSHETFGGTWLSERGACAKDRGDSAAGRTSVSSCLGRRESWSGRDVDEAVNEWSRLPISCKSQDL